MALCCTLWSWVGAGKPLTSACPSNDSTFLHTATGDAATVYQQCNAHSKLRAAILKPFATKQQQLKLHLAAKPRLQSKVTKMQEAVQADTFVAKFAVPTEMQQGVQLVYKIVTLHISHRLCCRASCF